MTAWIVALVSPEGDAEAWLTRDQQVTPALWDAGQYATQAEASAAAVMATSRDLAMVGLMDGRTWKPVPMPEMEAVET